MIKLYDEENNDGVLDGYIFIQKDDLKEVLGEEEYTEDYTEDELLSIFKYMIKENSYVISNDGLHYIEKLISCYIND